MMYVGAEHVHLRSAVFQVPLLLAEEPMMVRHWTSLVHGP